MRNAGYTAPVSLIHIGSNRFISDSYAEYVLLPPSVSKLKFNVYTLHPHVQQSRLISDILVYRKSRRDMVPRRVFLNRTAGIKSGEDLAHEIPFYRRRVSALAHRTRYVGHRKPKQICNVTTSILGRRRYWRMRGCTR